MTEELYDKSDGGSEESHKSLRNARGEQASSG